ncbi:MULTISPECIES: enoyl-CoA hydratase/isomerase family protein [Thalassospira]|uniref:3-hydroxyisobutyryl-CoA hydrolase n=2 Tax=Thalassospira TaxID=168934 RepID=A0A367W4I8_9PROT|nr:MULTISPECIES: enoyl-CoA hydratase/isomerase family protein [Thalassospira]MDG4719647.1 enoyl-CoA hydratase/isomerase family protein [Thalassospira sp. FZY0004]RCK36313.1 enoyl-CoA hydratase [Thalassospira profundimaris]
MNDTSNTSETKVAEAPVLFSQQGAVGQIVLNRPRALNALDLVMVDMMMGQLKSWEADPSIKVIVIEGAGEKAFCAGGDIRGLYDARKIDDEDMLDAFYRREYHLNHYIANYPKPYIALMDGITMGGGVGVSIHGQFRVVTERTLFAMPETGIGFFPDVGGGYFLPRCPGKIGMYLGLTGARIKAADCLYTGLATHGMVSSDLDRLKAELAVASYDDHAAETVADILGRHQMAFDNAPLAENREAIDLAFAGNSVVAIFEALADEGTEFGKHTLDVLSGKSPMALCISFEQIRQGGELTLAEVLNMEFRLSQRMVCKPDLFEGVRAVIVDKDHAPKWQHGDIGQVNPREVSEYFELLPSDKELNL